MSNNLIEIDPGELLHVTGGDATGTGATSLPQAIGRYLTTNGDGNFASEFWRSDAGNREDHQEDRFLAGLAILTLEPGGEDGMDVGVCNAESHVSYSKLVDCVNSPGRYVFRMLRVARRATEFLL